MNNKTEFILHDENLESKVLGSLVWSCKEGNFDAFFESRLSEDLFWSSYSVAIFNIKKEIDN